MTLKNLFKRKQYYYIFYEDNNKKEYFASYYKHVNASTWTQCLRHAAKFRSKSKATRVLNKIQLTTKRTLRLERV